MSRIDKTPSLVLMWLVSLFFAWAVFNSAAFAISETAPDSRAWIVVLLFAVGTAALIAGASLTNFGLRAMRAGYTARKSSPWAGALAGAGAVTGAVVASGFSGEPAYWMISTAGFAFLCGCGVRYLPYLHAQRADRPNESSPEPPAGDSPR